MKENEKEKATIIKESLSIIDKLGRYDENDLTEDDVEEIKDLIKRGKRLIRNRYWQL